ncbi:MAG: hypothetical protein U9R00_02395, partial [Patescibacteria group bacterium]|nr:hypothetical protein [Patescibacteria group bacterium]
MKSYKSIKSRKGQAALEFLTTYGWAFLVILVMIGGLAYFGVFNFSDKLPDSCSLSNKLSCGSVFVITDNTTNTLQMQVHNNDLSKVTITDVSLIEKSLDGGTECSGTVSQDISPDKTVDLQVDMTNLGDCGIS